MNRFWRWFYSYEGILLRLSKRGKVWGFVLVVISFACVIGAGISAFVFNDMLMLFQFGFGVMICAYIVRGLIAKDLSRQLKEQWKINKPGGL